MKKIIEIKESFSPSDLDGLNIDQVIEYFQELKVKLIGLGMGDALYNWYMYSWELEYDSEFVFSREETDEEYQERIKKENSLVELYKKQQEETERATYERLKQKYEPCKEK